VIGALDSAKKRGGHAMQMKNQASVDDGVVESLDAWRKNGAAVQVSEYVHEITAELTRMAKLANCHSLAYLLEIASLEAKRLARGHGCETSSLATAREENCH
jgi:hypothetical protein